ncbi:MAG: BMP family ABC transporter substrate-binding protein, partial [Gudongella sp.]|nr:BMP family ABC transporter substrate-binding protein [Gudongella sp.]
MKRIRLISIVVAFLLIGTIVPGFGQTPLHLEEARSLYELKLFQGISASEFVPDLESMSNREQAMTIIARALQWDLDIGSISPFGDVSRWAQPYVAKAYEIGITNGISATEFGANKNVTQRELATWMLRALGYDGQEAWENTAQLSEHIGTRLESSKMNSQINRDVLVGMLYFFMKEGREVSSDKTLIQQYVDKYPQYGSIALNAGMIKSEDGQTETTKIGLVVDAIGMEDSYINRMVWEGIERFAEDNNLPASNYSYVKADSDSNLMAAFNQRSIMDSEIVVANGFIFRDEISRQSELNPSKKYIIIDDYVDRPNVTSMVFKEEEGSFLVGLAAGLKAAEDGSNKVGFIGGIEFGLIQEFEAGFEAGARAANPSVEVLFQYIGSFEEESLAKSAAAALYDEGVNVIFHAAGPAGMGIVEEAKERSENGELSWVIGVDYDQYEDGIYAPGKSVVLTSMLKKFDNAAYSVIEQVFSYDLEGGFIELGVENDGVGLPDSNPNLSGEMSRRIEDYIEKISSGEIS